MVRQGLRSLQNGRAGLPHYPPPSPKSREAERPGSRKAGKPKGREAERPGSRKAERGETREAGEGRKGRNTDWADQTKPRVRYLILPVCHDAIRHATTQRPRGDENISCSLLIIIFQSKLRVCLTHPPSHSNGHILNREMVLMPIPLEPGYVSFGPKSRTISCLTCGRPESGLVADARLQPTSGGEAIPTK